MFVRVQGKRMPHSTHHLKKWGYSGVKGINYRGMIPYLYKYSFVSTGRPFF
jgi:hypothetical protein